MILHENKEIVLEDARKGETPTLKNIQKWLKTTGATLSCETGAAITYDDGYQLAFDGTDDKLYDINLDNLWDIKLVKDKIDKRLKDATFPYVGLWYDNGIVYIEYSEHILERNVAFSLGIQSKQLSLFNWGYPNNGDPQFIDLVELRKGVSTTKND